MQNPKKSSSFLLDENLEDFLGFCKGFNLDETGFNAFLYRPHAYSAKSAPVRAKISGKRYQRFSLVAAYVEGQLVAPRAYQQIMDSTLFEAWFEHFLMPYLTEKSLIIMDNTRFIEYLY